MKKMLFIALLLIPTLSFACGSDFDCSLGSQCIKNGDNFNGVCSGGMNPGNSYDQKPVYNPMELSGHYGNTCSSDFDCGIGHPCVKSGYSFQGVCQ